MKTYLSRRIPVVVAAGLALVMLAMGFLAALGVRSLVAGAASADPAAPNPGHLWTELENHGTSGSDYWLGTTASGAALELKVNNSRALRLEPDTDANRLSPNLIAGSPFNSVDAGVVGATIGGGGAKSVPPLGPNSVKDNWATVGGGYLNTAGGGAADPSDVPGATVGGGAMNQAIGDFTAVGGGNYNRATGDYGAICGGSTNWASAPAATVGGGWLSVASGSYSTVAGGSSNTASGSYSTVDGGGSNVASQPYAAIGGGEANTASGSYATVAGGGGNGASGSHSTVGGGASNVASQQYATVGGGASNVASQQYAAIGGGSNNNASAQFATISGGGSDNAALGNRVTDDWGTVGGGRNNQAGDNAGTTSDKPLATVGGGAYNTASDYAATVGGGVYNTASGFYSTVPGGNSNEALGAYSFAAGRQARAVHDGSFVWADSTGGAFSSIAADQFFVRAHGGVYFQVNNGHYVAIYDTGVNLISTVTGARLTLAGVWTNASDAALKENFTAVDGQTVLANLAEMPISNWNSKAEDASIRHMGPTAQDFYAAFGLGDSDTSIGTVDADGVALAAIQGLYELSQEQGARIVALEEENASLQQRLDSLEARVSALEGGTGGGAAVSTASSSGVPVLWPVLGGGLALVLVGLVLAQRRLAGGRR